MIGPHARGVIAVVADDHARRDWSSVDDFPDCVCCWLPAAMAIDAPVAGTLFAGPRPAMSGLIDLGPNTLGERPTSFAGGTNTLVGTVFPSARWVLAFNGIRASAVGTGENKLLEHSDYLARNRSVTPGASDKVPGLNRAHHTPSRLA